jgi:hypothetical protein
MPTICAKKNFLPQVQRVIRLHEIAIVTPVVFKEWIKTCHHAHGSKEKKSMH